MNEASAHLSVLEPATPPPAAITPPAGEAWSAGPEPDRGWSVQKMFFLIILALILHVALVVAFGTKKQYVPKPVINVPRLQFASRADELLELDNPALFALPNPRDFASAVWQQTPTNPPPSFRWPSRPGELSRPAPENLGAAFLRFMQTNQFGLLQPDFKPAPQFAQIVSAFGPELPRHSTLQISGALAQRRLLAQPTLPSLDWNDVIAPSRVEVTVSPTGNVVSAVLLPSDNSLEAAGRSPKGDTNAVVLARGLKFAPAAQIALGEITFFWLTTPLPSTNAPAGPDPSP